jgi:uncharacterized damage-inducible protein DinB
MMSENGSGDASVLTKLFQHNLWANLKLLDFCNRLSDEQLDAMAVGCFGSIRATLVHIADAEVDYVHMATGKPSIVPLPIEQFPGFSVLKDCARWAGEGLLALAKEARVGTTVHVEYPQEPVYEFPLDSFIVQIINHSTEHRAQIATIITQLGIEPPAMSGWKFMREMGELREM